MTTLAAGRYPHLGFARAALPRLPCRDESFDAITANFVVNHTPDPREALTELFRVLRVGGLLVATIWTSKIVPLNQLWNDVMSIAGVTPPTGVRLPPELDFDRTAEGFARVLVDAGFGPVDCRETSWTFTISPDDLWVAVEAGIAVIGQTYTAQDARGRRRLRAAYEEITSVRSSPQVVLPSTALIASARRDA